MNHPGEQERSDRSRTSAYWAANVRLLIILLLIWFGVSYVCGILLVEQLNRVRLPGSGFKLGFWFAQQGSIYFFVVIVFTYAALMNRMDRKYGVSEDAS